MSLFAFSLYLSLMTGNSGCAGMVSPGPGFGGKVACPQQVPAPEVKGRRVGRGGWHESRINPGNNRDIIGLIHFQWQGRQMPHVPPPLHPCMQNLCMYLHVSRVFATSITLNCFMSKYVFGRIYDESSSDTLVKVNRHAELIVA